MHRSFSTKAAQTRKMDAIKKIQKHECAGEKRGYMDTFFRRERQIFLTNIALFAILRNGLDASFFVPKRSNKYMDFRKNQSAIRVSRSLRLSDKRMMIMEETTP